MASKEGNLPTIAAVHHQRNQVVATLLHQVLMRERAMGNVAKSKC